MIRHRLRYMVLLALWLGASAIASALPASPWIRNSVQDLPMDAVGNSVHFRGSRAEDFTNWHIIGPSVPISGTVRLVAIPVAFQPDKEVNTSGTGTFPYRTWGPASAPDYLAGRLQRLTQYYTEVSGGRVQLQCTLAPLVTVPGTMSTYPANSGGGTTLRDAALKLADPNVDFSRFDIVMLIHAGASRQNSGLTGDYTTLFTISWGSTTAGYKTNDQTLVNAWISVPETDCNDALFRSANRGYFSTAFNTQADQAFLAYEANPTPTLTGIIIPHYWDVVGSWAHEVGHAFGLPDLYIVPGASGTTATGTDVEDWSLMAGGSWLPYPTANNINPTTFKGVYDPALDPYTASRPLYGSSPCHPDAWCKKLMGWANIVNVTGRLADERIVPQASSSGVIYRLWMHGSESQEYFLAENRAKVGFDQALPEGGLIFYQIDDTVGDVLSQTTTTGTYTNTLQSSPTHPRVRPVSADNDWTTPTVGTVFPYAPTGQTANTHFGENVPFGFPSSLSYGGERTYVDVSNIRRDGNDILATLQTFGSADILFTAPLAAETIYVSYPIVRAKARYMDPASFVVTLHTPGGEQISVSGYTYDTATGDLNIPLGPLAGEGVYTVEVSGREDNAFPDPQRRTRSLTFTYRARPLMLPGLYFMSFPVSQRADRPARLIDVFIGAISPQIAWYDPDFNAQLGRVYGYRYYSRTVDRPLVEFSSTRGTVSDASDATRMYNPAGKAYWVKLSQNYLPAMPFDVMPGNLSYRLPLRRGFNMVGSPYAYAVAMNSLLVRVGGRTYSMSEAIAQRIVDGALYGWSGSGYTVVALPNGELQPWQGFWLFVRTNLAPTDPTVASTVELIFQPVPSAQAFRAAVTPTTGRTRADATNWAFTVQGKAMAGHADAQVQLGVRAEATNRADAGLDLLAPPMAPEGIALASIAAGDGISLLRDYRRPAEGAGYVWDLVVRGEPGTEVMLTWPDLTQVPSGYALMLRDAATGEERYLRTSPCYRVELGAQETERRLQLVAETGGAGTLQIRNLQATQTRRAGVVAITCQVTSAATLAVEIRTITGRLITRLPAATRAAGSVALTWDGRDTQGRLVPRGTYQCQVHASADNGQTVKAVTVVGW